MVTHSQPGPSLKLCAQASPPSPGALALAFFEEATSYFLCVASPSQCHQLTPLRALSLGCQQLYGLLYPNTLLAAWWLLFEALLLSEPWYLP